MIVAEKLLGLDPTAPQMTLLRQFRTNGAHIYIATAMTGAIGLALMQAIKYVVAGNAPAFEIEQLFGNARLMATALAAAGGLIIGRRPAARHGSPLPPAARQRSFS